MVRTYQRPCPDTTHTDVQCLTCPPMSLVFYCKVLPLTLSIPWAIMSACSLSLELIPRLSVLSTIPTTPLLTSTVLLCFVLKCLQVHIPHLRYSLNETFTASIGIGLLPSSPLLIVGSAYNYLLSYLLVPSSSWCLRMLPILPSFIYL